MEPKSNFYLNIEQMVKITFKKSLFLLLALVTLNVSYSQQIAINEVMASNDTSITDEDGSYEDWIELYNYGTDPVNL